MGIIRRLLKLFILITKIFTTLAVAGLVFGLYLLLTPQGTTPLLTMISQLSPYEIHYKQVEGYCARRLTFEDLEIRGPHITLRAAHLHAQWTLLDLLRPIKKLELLEADNLIVQYENKNNKENKHYASLLSLAENIFLRDSQLILNEDRHTIDYLHVRQTIEAGRSVLQLGRYRGSLGEAEIVINEALRATWNLHFERAPFFTQYFPGKIQSHGQVRLPKREWHDPNNVLQIVIRGDDATLSGHHVKHFEFSINGTLAKHHATITGTANTMPFYAAFQGALGPTAWQGTLNDVSIQHPIGEWLQHSHGPFRVDWKKNRLALSFDLLLGNKHPLHATLQIKPKAPYALTGKIHLKIETLKSLATMIPEFRRIQGGGNIELQLFGTLKNVLYSGKFSSDDIRVKMPFVKDKAVFHNVLLSVNNRHACTLHAQGTLGNGHLWVQGTGSVDPTHPVLSIKLRGEQLLLSDTPEYYIVANPDLLFTIQRTGLTLTGNIAVPHAKIRSLKNPHTLSPSKDVVIVSPHSPTVPRYAPYSLSNQLYTKLDVILGDNISYEGYGFKTQAKGQIQIKQSPGQPTTAKGKITLDKGRYRAYGKRFDLSVGELIFSGGVIDNPTVNVRAERKIKPTQDIKTLHHQSLITVGVHFSGPLKNARIDFYSSPAMSNADIISYLVLGQPQGELQSAQGAILFEALSQLTFLSGHRRSDVPMSLAEQLKLDQLGLSKKNGTTSHANSLEDTVLTMGKQLSDRLYLHYSLGLLDASNSIGLRYFINKNITLEASTGTEGSSADLIVTFESA